MWFDPPKSPLKKGDFEKFSPFFKGSQRGLGGFPHERLAWVRGDQNVVGLRYRTCVYTVAYKRGGLGWGKTLGFSASYFRVVYTP
jgi:hypothetical protein